MLQEIERRFISRIVDERALHAAPSALISQGYLTRSGPTIRIRSLEDSYIMTIKVGSGMVRQEIEFPVPDDAGEELLALADGLTIEKRRYRVGRWEIDLFHGVLEGLVIAEVELVAEDEPLPEIPPCIELIREVTGDSGFSNRALAELGEKEATALIAMVERL